MNRSLRRKSFGFDALFFLQNFFLLLYCSELVFPFITSFGGSNYLSFVCFFGWLTIAVIRKPWFMNQLLPSSVVLLLMWILTSILPYLYGYTDIAHRFIGCTAIFSGFLILKYYKDANEIKALGVIMTIVGALTLVTTLTTLNALFTDSYAARRLGGSEGVDLLSYKKNIGGYQFIYYLDGFSLISLFLFFYERKPAIRAFWIASFLLTGLTISKSNFMTALIVWVGGTIYLIAAMSIKSRRWALRVMLAIIVFVLVLIFYDQIVELLPKRITSVIGNADASSLLQSIFDEFVGDRWPVMLISVEAFLKRPLLGVMGNSDLFFDGSYYQGFGQHSFFLDIMALYGLPIGLSANIALIRTCKFQRREGIASKLGKALMFYMVVMFLFNNATNSIGLAVFVVGPYVQEMVSRREKYETTCPYRKVHAQLREA